MPRNRYKVTIASDQPSNTFTYSTNTRRYRNVNSGRFLGREEVRHELDSIIDKSINRLKEYTIDLRDGNNSLSVWQDLMADEIKNLHISFTALANGGWNNVTANDWDRVSTTVAKQYNYLRKFAEQIYTGEQLPNGTMVSRATLYADSARVTYENERRLLETNSGANQEKNILGGSDHCNGCVDAALSGWVDIGTLTPIGDRQCQARCRCVMIYRLVSNGSSDYTDEYNNYGKEE